MSIAEEKPEFDHLLHWVPDVAKAVEAYRAIGLPAHANEVLDGFQNGGWRLHERYLEILTITDTQRLHASRYARGIELLRPAMTPCPDLVARSPSRSTRATRGRAPPGCASRGSRWPSSP